jgi:Fe-S-cluster containining protein
MLYKRIYFLAVGMKKFEKHCKGCRKDAHCCIFKKTGFTFISPKDAKNIKQKINKDYSYFLDYSPLSKKVVDVLRDCDPALEGRMRYLQLDKKNRILRLKTKKDGRCIFLGNDGKCEIYSIRPNICRIFPFWAMRLISRKIKVIEHDNKPRCKAICSISKIKDDVEKAISKKKAAAIRKIFKDIENEAKDYKKNVRGFAKELICR